MKNSADVGTAVIVSETSIGSGLRRIDMVVGEAADELVRRDRDLLAELARSFNATPEQLPERVQALRAQLKEAEKERDKLRDAGSKRPGRRRRRRRVATVKHGRVDYVTETVDASNLDELAAYADRYLEIVKSGIVTVVGGGMFVIKVSNDLVLRIRCHAPRGPFGDRRRPPAARQRQADRRRRTRLSSASKRPCGDQVQVPAQAERLLPALHGARHRHRPHQGPGRPARRRRRRGAGRRPRAAGAGRHVRRRDRRPRVGDPVLQPRARGGRGHGQDGARARWSSASPASSSRASRRRSPIRARTPRRESVRRDLDDAADGPAPRAARGAAPARAGAQLRPARGPPGALVDHQRARRRLPGHQPGRASPARTSRSPSSTPSRR